MTLLIVSKESALTETGTSALMTRVFQQYYSREFLLLRIDIHITTDFWLTQLAQKFSTYTVSREWWLTQLAHKFSTYTVSREWWLTQLAQKFSTYTVSREW